MADGEGGGAAVVVAEEALVELKRDCGDDDQRGAVVLSVRGVAAVRRDRCNGTVAAARVARTATASLRHAAQR